MFLVLKSCNMETKRDLSFLSGVSWELLEKFKTLIFHRKRYLVFLMFFLPVCLHAFEHFPDTTAGSWEGVVWRFDEADGTLSFSGTGVIGSAFLEGWSQEEGPWGYSPWSHLLSNVKRIVIGVGITGITSGAFAGFYNLEEVVLPSTMHNIGYYAFARCESLDRIQLPTSLSYIEERAFAHGTTLDSVKIPSRVQSIGIAAFYA